MFKVLKKVTHMHVREICVILFQTIGLWNHLQKPLYLCTQVLDCLTIISIMI
jgi:hypothetical protein